MTSITQEHSKLVAVPGGPRLRRRGQWGSTFNYNNPRSVVEPATRVFIHISVTNVENYRSNDAHARALEAIGRSRFSSTGVSYNRACMHDGTLYELQPIGRRGAHTVNDFRRSTCSTSGCPGRGSSLTAPSWNLNYNSRAYVIAQNVQHSVTDKMVDQLARAIVADYRAGFITKAAAENPHGHRCVSSKSCPGNNMWARMGALESKIKGYIKNGLKGDDDVRPSEWNSADKKAVADAVWNTDGVVATPDGYGDKNKFWKPSSIIRSGQMFARRAFQNTNAGIELSDGRKRSPRWLWREAHNQASNAAKLIKASQPLLETAAKGAPLSAAQVAEIAEAVKQASIEITASDVASELDVDVQIGVVEEEQ